MPDDNTPTADTTPTKPDPAPIKKPGKTSTRKRRRTPGKRSRRTSGKRPSPGAAKRSTMKRKPGRPPKPFDVATLRAKLGLSRPALAKLLSVHVNSVANWERGATIREKNLAKLRQLASSGGKVSPRKPGRPPKVVAGNGALDVAALRSSLGLSRSKFAKLVGAAPNSVFNWEKGKTVPAERFVAKLRALASGKGAAPARSPRARRGARPGRRRVTIVGEVPVVYADAVSVVREGARARVRFGMRVPGERGARCVADVVVSGDVLWSLGR